MAIKKIVPVNYKKDFYYDWLFTFQCVNQHRKDLAAYWYNQASKIKKTLDECPEDLKPVSLYLYTTALDHYYYYMTCASSLIARELNINLEFRNKGCGSTCCPSCHGLGYIQDKQCVCRSCRGYGRAIDWIFRKKESMLPSITIVMTNWRGAVIDYLAIGESLFSML